MQTQPPPLQQEMNDKGGRASRPWAIWFQGVAQFVATVINYQTVKAAGTAKPQESALNFLAPFVVTDNSASGSTDISLPSATTYALTATPQSSLAVMPGRFRSVVYGPFASPRMVSVTIHSDGGPGANSDLELVAGADSLSMVTVSGNSVHNGGGYFSACYLLSIGHVYQVNNNATGSGHTDTVVGWSEVQLSI